MNVVAGLLIALFAVNGAAMIAAVPPMRARVTHLGFSVGTYRLLGSLQVLAAVGVLAGILWQSLLGLAASIGMTLMMSGAVMVHARRGDPVVRFLPAVVVALLCLSCVVLFARSST